MRGATVNLVTGGFSYTGGFILRELVGRGREVRIMTRKRRPPDQGRGVVGVVPYAFDDPSRMREALRGVRTVYNTYWIRFPHRGLDFNAAIENTRQFLEACEDAGVERFVHISVSNASHDSPLPYYRAKAETEEWVRRSSLSWRIIRPTLIVGPNDILVNNIAWLLRKFPVFVIPGKGTYRLQPVTGDDVARIAVDAAEDAAEAVMDAAGPEILTFHDLVVAVRNAVGASSRILHGPARLALALGRVAGFAVRDVVLTWDEFRGLRDEMLVSRSAPLGRTAFSGWLRESAGSLGDRYASELGRHYRGQASA